MTGFRKGWKLNRFFPSSGSPGCLHKSPLDIDKSPSKRRKHMQRAQGVNQQSTEEDAAAFGVIQGKNKGNKFNKMQQT